MNKMKTFEVNTATAELMGGLDMENTQLPPAALSFKSQD